MSLTFPAIKTVIVKRSTDPPVDKTAPKASWPKWRANSLGAQKAPLGPGLEAALLPFEAHPEIRKH
jgi:hypothetical protein